MPIVDYMTKSLQRLEAGSAKAENELLIFKGILNLVIDSPVNYN